MTKEFEFKSIELLFDLCKIFIFNMDTRCLKRSATQ